MTENNFNFTNGVSYDVWYEQKRLIDQLKKENEEMKEYKAVVDELADKQIILTNKDKMPELYENGKDLALNRYRTALEEIGGLIQSTLDDFEDDEEVQLSYCHNISLQILDIISKTKGEAND